MIGPLCEEHMLAVARPDGCAGSVVHEGQSRWVSTGHVQKQDISGERRQIATLGRYVLTVRGRHESEVVPRFTQGLGGVTCPVKPRGLHLAKGRSVPPRNV